MQPVIEAHHRLPTRGVLDDAADTYLATFSQAPYLEPPEARDGFIDRVERYSARDGFTLVLAGDDGRVVGLALAVTAHPGDWWRDQVAANLSSAETEKWLGESCLELVHLAVLPTMQGRGIGGRLLDETVAASTSSTGILTVDPGAAPARRLYESRGWRVVRESIAIGTGSGSILMARSLDG